MTDDAKLSREAIERSVAQLPDQPFAFAPQDDLPLDEFAPEEVVSITPNVQDTAEDTFDNTLDESNLAAIETDPATNGVSPSAAAVPVLTDSVATITHHVVPEATVPRTLEEIPVLTADAPKAANMTQSGIDADMLAEIEGFMAELEADGTLKPEAVAPAAVTQDSADDDLLALAEGLLDDDQDHPPATENDFLPEPEAMAAPEPTNVVELPLPDETFATSALPSALIAESEHLVSSDVADIDINIDPSEIAAMSAMFAAATSAPPTPMPTALAAPLSNIDAPIMTVTQAAPPAAPRQVATMGNQASSFSLNIPSELHAQLSKKIDQLVVEAATSITNELQVQLSERVEHLLQQAIENALPVLIENMVLSLRSEVRGHIREQLPIIVNDVLAKTRLSSE